MSSRIIIKTKYYNEVEDKETSIGIAIVGEKDIEYKDISKEEFMAEIDKVYHIQVREITSNTCYLEYKRIIDENYLKDEVELLAGVKLIMKNNKAFNIDNMLISSEVNILVD